MSRNAKVGIGAVVAVVAACVCLCLCAAAALLVFAPALADRVMETDPDKARAMGAELLDYELPEGYHELAAMNILTVKMVMIGPAESAAQGDTLDHMIIIAQVASKELMDDPQLREQMQRSVEQGFRNSVPAGNVDWELVDSSPTTIAGQEVMLHTYEAVGENGETMRQLLTDVFEGKNGATFIMALGTQDNWPKEAIEAFLGSIK
jgi:hypothetical protein